MDFRLNVFLSVARHLNFTRAASELYISQPAISRHIQELESEYKVQLFERSNNKVQLTTAGKVFLKHAQNISEMYKSLQLDMNLLTGNFTGEIRIGASTTIAQYILPPIVAKFLSIYPDIHLSVVSGNTEQIEHLLEQSAIDIGLIEGFHHKASFKYVDFKKDELVLVTNANNIISDEITLDELSALPLVLREAGSGTLEVIEKKLNQYGKKISQMNIFLQLGDTESIKLFLENNMSVFAIISIAAVARELANNILKVVEISNLEMNREFSLVVNQGTQNELLDRFISFCINYR
ncbi:MAG: LysR substrate-binding domain-containing protein [Dysgonomonas sp.]